MTLTSTLTTRHAITDSASWDPGQAARIIAEHAGVEGAALPILHALQGAFGFVPVACEPIIADALNLSRAEIHGIITFYHDFRRVPSGRHVLQLCRAEACQSVDGGALANDLLRRLGIDWGETTRDGSLTIEPVYCLGLCACAPAALVDGVPVARLDANDLDVIVEDSRRA